MTTFAPTEKQIHYAEDISNALGIELPSVFNVVTYAKFIANNLDDYNHRRLRMNPADPLPPETVKEEAEPELQPEKPKKTRGRKKAVEPVYTDSLPFPSIGNLPEGMAELDSDLIRIAERYGAAIIIVNKAS